MIAKAKELAAGDDAMLAMIADIEEGSSRGRIGGAIAHAVAAAGRLLRHLDASPITAASWPNWAIAGDGDADLDLLVTDENGNTICYDTSYSDQLYCSWTPAWDGYFIVTSRTWAGCGTATTC